MILFPHCKPKTLFSDITLNQLKQAIFNRLSERISALKVEEIRNHKPLELAKPYLLSTPTINREPFEKNLNMEDVDKRDEFRGRILRIPEAVMRYKFRYTGDSVLFNVIPYNDRNHLAVNLDTKANTIEMVIYTGFGNKNLTDEKIRDVKMQKDENLDYIEKKLAAIDREIEKLNEEIKDYAEEYFEERIKSDEKDDDILKRL